MKQFIGYHFTGLTLRNGAPIPAVGEWLHHEGVISPCHSGLHASRNPFDALEYAPGETLHKVILRGELKSHGSPVDKYVGRERRIIATIDARNLLRDFARACALSVVELWSCPEVTRKYLETGDESIRAAARAAAWDAAWAAARDAARDAAWDAAWAAARAAARDAAWDAAWAAARENQRKLFKKMVSGAFKK